MDGREDPFRLSPLAYGKASRRTPFLLRALWAMGICVQCHMAGAICPTEACPQPFTIEFLWQSPRYEV